MEKITKEQLPALVQEILSKIPSREARGGRAAFITLSGDLGAGKTTLVQALASALGITEAVQSPTYVLMKKYSLQGQQFATFIHIDAYRLKDAAEFAALTPEEFFSNPDVLVALEWPEMVQRALPTADIALKLSSEGLEEGERYIHIN